MKTKYIILFFCTVMVGFSACNNQTSKHSRPSIAIGSNEKKSPGKIEFTKEMHNFGTLKVGETVSYSFQFRNIGGSSFHLTMVEPTCGCLSVRYNKDSIESQSVSAIEVIFQSAGEWGNQIKTVNIETSGGEIKTLTIGAYVENEIFNNDINNLK